MEKKIIFTYTLADFLEQYEAAKEDGFTRTGNNEDWPLFVNNGFYIGLEKRDNVGVAEPVAEPVTEPVAEPVAEPFNPHNHKPKRERKTSL